MTAAPRLDTSSRALWWYAGALLCFWTAVPEIRRLLEWRGEFQSFEVLSAVPLLATFPFAIWMLTRVPTLSRGLIYLLWIWLGSFFYAGVVGWLLGNGRSDIYDFLQFVTPAFLAAWVCSQSPIARTYRRLSTILLAIAVGVSIYGIVQYVALPAWDAVWMQRALRMQGLISEGVASPFQVRVFSVLSSSAPCATFLAVALAFNFYRLQENRLLPLAGMSLCVVTLTLTLVRSAWVALLVGVFVYFLCSRRPIRAVAIIVSLILVVCVFFTAISPWLATRTGRDVISQRVQTFWDLQGDTSVNQRTASSAELLAEAIDQPAGQGLGVIGTAARLTSFTQNVNSVDGGLQARLVEMGLMGFIGYVTVILLAVALTVRRWWYARRCGANGESDMLAALIAVQAALIAMDLSLDAHVNLIGALFWITVGLTLTPRQAEVHNKRDEVLKPALARY